METNRLKQFCVVYETGNLRKAAEILHISHGALSKSLKVLQEETGLTLLAPSGRGLVITDEGREFVHKARALLDMEAKILARTAAPAAGFRVATFESFSTHLLGGKWAAYFGDLPLELHELSSGRLETAVADGTVDAAITYEPVPVRDLEFLPLGRVSMGIYHRRGVFRRTAFEALPFVAPLLPLNGGPNVARGIDGWPEHEIPRLVQYRVDLLETGLALARAGQAAIFIPDFVARIQNERLAEEYRLVEREYPRGVRKLERRVFLVVKSARQRERTVRRLAEMIRTECGV